MNSRSSSACSSAPFVAWRRHDTQEGHRDATGLPSSLVAAWESLAALGVAAGQPRGNPQRLQPKVDNPWFPLKPGTRSTEYADQGRQPSRDVVTVTHQDEGDRRRAAASSSRIGSTSTASSTSGRPTGTRRTPRATSGTSARRRPSSTRTATSRAPKEPGWPAWTARSPASTCRRVPRRSVGPPGVLQGPCGGSLPGGRMRRDPLGPPDAPVAVLTKEWTPLEPGVVDNKSTCAAIGTVLELTVKGGDERNELDLGAARSMSAAVEARGVGRRYGSLTAVEDLCFTAEAGEILGVLGPNGAGKTTAIRVLTTILRRRGDVHRRRRPARGRPRSAAGSACSRRAPATRSARPARSTSATTRACTGTAAPTPERSPTSCWSRWVFGERRGR